MAYQIFPFMLYFINFQGTRSEVVEKVPHPNILLLHVKINESMSYNSTQWVKNGLSSGYSTGQLHTPNTLCNRSSLT
jgi:hypothetical protein